MGDVLFNDAISCCIYVVSVVDEWVDEYGALLEWYWQGKTEVRGEEPA
jgi:hypothetical protein